MSSGLDPPNLFATLGGAARIVQKGDGVGVEEVEEEDERKVEEGVASPPSDGRFPKDDREEVEEEKEEEVLGEPTRGFKPPELKTFKLGEVDCRKLCDLKTLWK